MTGIPSSAARSAFLLAPAAVVVGHWLSSAVLHLSGASSHGLLGWVGLGEIVVPVAALGVLLALAVRSAGTSEEHFGRDVRSQLTAQLLVIGLVEVVEHLTVSGAAASVTTLHDPVVWIGIGFQLLTAIVAVAGVRSLASTVVAILTRPRRLHAIDAAVRAWAVGSLDHVAVRLPQAIVHRGPPVVAVLEPTRS